MIVNIRDARAIVHAMLMREGALVAGEGDTAWSPLPYLAFGYGYASRQPESVQVRNR